MVTPHAFNCYCYYHRQLQPMDIAMKTANFIFLLIAIGFSSCSGEKDSSENENSTDTPSDIPREPQKSDPESKPMEKNSNFRGHQRKFDFLLTPNQKLIIEPKFYYPQFADDSPQSGFSNNERRRQNMYLSDNTGTYNVKLQNFQGEPPAQFETALGAISAHVLNQKHQDYVPYPPNGDPYNYPAYRGIPRATEPPAIRAYERNSNSNHDVHSGDFNRQNSRGIFSADDYHLPFSNHFQNFDINSANIPEFHNEGAFYTEQRRNFHPLYDSRWYEPNRRSAK